MNWLKKDCEPYREMISALLDDELSAGDKARLRAHLAHCDDCSTLCVAFAAADGALDQTMEDVPEALHRAVMENVQEQERGQRMLRLKRYLKPALVTAACLVMIAAALFAMQPVFRMGRSGDSGGNSAAAPAAVSGEASGTTGAMSGRAADEPMENGASPETMDVSLPELESAGNEEGTEDAAEDNAGKGVAFYQSAPFGAESVAPAEKPVSRETETAPTPAPSSETDKVLMLLELEVSAVEETEDGGFTAVILSDSSTLLSPGVRVTVRSPDAEKASSQSPALRPGDRVMVRYNSLSMIPEGWLVTADSVELIS